MRDLAIIIVSYKTREPLERCLASIFAGGYPFSYRVVVVDNASGDGTPGMVISKYPDALMVALEENRGPASAVNTGIRSVDSRHVLLLDPGAEVAPETLVKMVRFLDEHHHVGIVGRRSPGIQPGDYAPWFPLPPPLSRGIGKSGFHPRVAQALLGVRFRHPEIAESGAKRVDAVNSECLAIRRDTINQIGLLDENPALRDAGADWCVRAARRGWETYALTGDDIILHGPAGTEREPYAAITATRRDALYLYRKHYASPLAGLWSAAIRLEILSRWFMNAARLKKKPNDIKIKSKHDAYRDLFKEVFAWRSNVNNGRKQNHRQG